MADGANPAALSALEADLAQIQREDDERLRRSQALDHLTGPNVGRQDALSAAQAGERLGIDREQVPVTPLAREEATRGRLDTSLSSGRRLEEWIADRRMNAAIVAGPDLNRLVEAEMDWRSIADEVLDFSGAWDALGEQVGWHSETNQRRGRAVRRWAGDTFGRYGTEEEREQTWRNLQRNSREMSENVQSPDWWRTQARNAQRSAGAAWEETREFFNGLPDAWKDAQEQYEVGQRLQEQADIGWRIMNGAELPGDRSRLAELRGENRFPIIVMGAHADPRSNDLRARIEVALREQGVDTSALYPAPRTWLGPAAQSLPMTIRGFMGGLRGGLATGTAAAGVSGATAGVLGQAGPQAGLPEEFVTVPAAAAWGFRRGFGPGATVGAGYEMMKTEAGLAYVEFTDPSFVDENGNPLDPEIARNAAMLVGLINGTLEVASLRTLVRRLPGGDALLSGGTRAQLMARMRALLRQRNFRTAISSFARGVVEVGVVEGVTEFSQESVTVAAMRAAAATDGDVGFPLPTHQEGFQRALQAGWFGFQAGTVLGGAAGGGRFIAVDAPRAFRTHRDAQHLQTLADHIASLELRNSNVPGVMNEVAGAITRDGPGEVYVDAEQFVRFFQEHNVDPFEVAESIPGVGSDALAEAVEAGSAVAIPTSSMASHVMGTDMWTGLQPHSRLTPDGFTPNELRRLRENEPELMREVEAIVRRQETAGEAAETHQAIEGAIARKLDEAGVTIPDANRIQARLVATIIMNMANASGRNAVDLFEAYFGEITGPFEDEAKSRSPQAGQMAQEALPDFNAEAVGLKNVHGLEDLRLTLNEGRGELVIDLISVSKKQRNNGFGGRAVQAINALADKHGLKVVVNPPKRGGGLGTRSQGAVIKFFARNGYVENKGDNRDPSVTHAMYRLPSGVARAVAQEDGRTGARPNPRAVDAEDARAGRSPIPEPGSPDFAALLERAVDKQANGQKLTQLEAWAIGRASRGLGAVSLESVQPLYHSDEAPRRAGPLPPAGSQVVNSGSSSDPASARARVSLSAARLSPEAESRLKSLIAQRDRLAREIERRMENERDLPEMVEARKDAAAMRGLAYCTARGMVRHAAAVAGAGAVVGSTLAAAGAGGVLAPSDVADGTLPPGAVVTPPADRVARRGPSATAIIPPAESAAVQLPETHPEEALAGLTADAAAEAVVPESISQASAQAALDDPDLPIATNNMARPQSENSAEN